MIQVDHTLAQSPRAFAPVGVEPRSTAAQQDPTPPQTSPQSAAVPVPQPQPYGNLVSQQRSGQSTFYHFDGLGSAAALTTSTQTVSDSYTYRAFGDIAASSGTTTNPYQWVGREGYYRDQEASELNLGRRHYNTATGRFTTEDPIDYHSGDSNFYRYVGNNPIVRVDPDGLQPPQPPQPPKPSPPPPASYSSVARSAVRLGSKFAAEMSSGVYKAFGEDGKVSDLLDPLDRFLTELQPLTRTAEQSGLLTSGMASQIRGLLSDLISLIREVKAILPEDAVQVALDLVQVILGVVGLIPLLGEAADAVDAGISLARRDWIGTGLGVVNLIPVVSIATGAAVLFARKFPRLVAGIKGLGPKARQLLQLIKSRLSKALEILPEPVKTSSRGVLQDSG